MASSSRSRRPSRLARFAVLTCGGIAGWCVIALFTAHGQAHAFDVGAVLAGVGFALLVSLARWLAGVDWSGLASAALFATLWDDLTRRR